MPEKQPFYFDELLHSGHEVRNELKLHQVSDDAPILVTLQDEIISPGTLLYVEALGSGDDGLAARVRYLQGDTLKCGYVRAHELLESAECIFTEAT